MGAARSSSGRLARWWAENPDDHFSQVGKMVGLGSGENHGSFDAPLWCEYTTCRGVEQSGSSSGS